jgi:hypothetical protein
MSASQVNLSAYHPPPAYTAEPRRGREQRLLIHDPSIIPLTVPSPPRQWRDQFVKHSKSGGVTLKVSNQRSHVPSPIHHGGTNDPIRGSVDLAKTENVTSVELKECVFSASLSLPLPDRLSRKRAMNQNGASQDLHCFVFYVQLEGRLLLHEVAAGGASSTELCSQRTTLWTRDSNTRQGGQISLPFALSLPTTFSDEHGTYVSCTGVE